MWVHIICVHVSLHEYLCMPIYLYIDIHINEKHHLLNAKIMKQLFFKRSSVWGV